MMASHRALSRLAHQHRRLSALSLQPTPPFVLERFFAAHEFSCKHALCSSDTEAVSLADTVARMSGDTRALWDSLSLGYTETRGHPRMLELLAEDYDGLAPANFQELAPQEAILLTFAALLEPGDAVVATAPGYQSFFTCAEAAGGVVKAWRPRFDGGAAHFDVADLERLCAAHRPTCVAVNFPHNPTGALPSEEEWARVVDVCDAHGAYLFADEIYRGLGRTLPAAAAAYGRGISLGGLSKSLGMPGVRAGWLAAEDDAFLTRVAELRARPPAPSGSFRRATPSVAGLHDDLLVGAVADFSHRRARGQGRAAAAEQRVRGRGARGGVGRPGRARGQADLGPGPRRRARRLDPAETRVRGRVRRCAPGVGRRAVATTVDGLRRGRRPRARGLRPRGLAGAHGQVARDARRRGPPGDGAPSRVTLF